MDALVADLISRALLLPRRRVERCAVDHRLTDDERASGDTCVLKPYVLTEADRRKLRHGRGADEVQELGYVDRPVLHARSRVQGVQTIAAVDLAREPPPRPGTSPVERRSRNQR